ncbi:hypothetical protein LCGC14_2632090 [marine sediment metagenome]|uniref:Uncharacterized protein n=1 Tax=marine sediment metagenome TaxID=412755 RepID=A0A0F9A065_9ZZZZ
MGCSDKNLEAATRILQSLFCGISLLYQKACTEEAMKIKLKQETPEPPEVE